MSHKTYACCHDGCAHVICFEPEVEAKLRRTHEWWQCPSGHRQYFSGKTASEKRIDELEADLAIKTRHLQYAREERDFWVEAHDRAMRTCDWPLCGQVARSRAGLKIHMQHAHGMPTEAEQEQHIAEVEALTSPSP